MLIGARQVGKTYKIKEFCESDKPYKILVVGSLLGVKINRFNSSFPVGKVQMKYLYPMDFEEFLLVLVIGGMPEVVEEYINKNFQITDVDFSK